MVYKLRKRIGKMIYFYIVKSIRLSNGKLKRIDKVITKDEFGMKTKDLEKKYKDYFLHKEKELSNILIRETAKTSYIFNEEEIDKLETIRVSYKHLIKKLTKNQLKDVFDRFTANFTYNSNAIEGNSLTLKDVRLVMFDNRMVKGKELREVYETRNSRKVIDLIMRKKIKINHKDIIMMHTILMKDIDERKGYKILPNIILSAGREIETSKPENVMKEMTELIKWYDENISKMHPLEMASLFHGKFEKIHPFEDGNGRVGRFLINVILVNNGYPPLIIRNNMRLSYISALHAFDAGYHDKLERFLIEKFKDTYKKFFEVYVKYV